AGAPVAGDALNRNAPAVALDDLAHQGESYAIAAGLVAALGLEESVEHVRQRGRRDAAALVVHADARDALALFEPHLDAPAARHVLRGVSHQVGKAALDLCRIDVHVEGGT